MVKTILLMILVINAIDLLILGTLLIKKGD